MSDTYPCPPHGWVCFHCGEEFSVARQKCWDSALKAAREHFGTAVDDEPLCKLATMPNAELARRVREAENTAREAVRDRERAEEEAAGAHGELASIARLFKRATTVYEAWCMYDSMEGRALAAEEGRWIPVADDLPTVGQRIVARYEKYDTVWAGRYTGPKQSFDEWMPLPDTTTCTTTISEAAARITNSEVIDEAAKAVPENWLDPLLSGPDSPLKGNAGTWACPHIEGLLRGIQNRIRALKGG